MDLQDYINTGAFIIILDAPENFCFGIDGTINRIGERFKGIKMIPPGFHFVYWQICTDQGDLGNTGGFCSHFEYGEIYFLKWNRIKEMLYFVDTEGGGEEESDSLQRIRSNLFDLDRYLGLFPVQPTDLEQFRSLSKHITRNTLKRILSNKFHLFSSQSSALTSLSFSQLPNRKDIVDITADRLDQSAILDRLIQEAFKSKTLEIFGELELAFLIFIYGQNYEGFEQWKSLLSILCQSPTKIKNESKFYSELIDLLLIQFETCPDDLFFGIANESNLLIQWLQILVDEGVDQHDKNLAKKSSLLIELFNNKFGIDISCYTEMGEYAPTIVT